MAAKKAITNREYPKKAIFGVKFSGKSVHSNVARSICPCEFF